MVTGKYYDIYMTCPFKVSWHPGLIVESSGSWIALCRVSNSIDGPNERGLVI
jgi:hypothetical protein